MSREEKRYGFKPVSDKPAARETVEPVIRLGAKEAAAAEKGTRGMKRNPEPASHRLHVPKRDEFETRSHQPGIEALIEQTTANPDHLEQSWGENVARENRIPWGWFALIGLILAGGVIWSLQGVRQGETKAEQVKAEAEISKNEEAEEVRQASELIESIDATTASFFQAKDISDLLPLVRQPERVKPLMEKYYREHPLTPATVERGRILDPVTLGQNANFWRKSVSLTDGEVRNLIIEITPSGEPKVDWETYVCYQPMAWDKYALDRPQGRLDFRVYITPDNFFSHEFADSTQWDSFRLTAADSDETLFGYTPKGGELSEKIMELMKETNGEARPMLLRLSVPPEVQSRRGVRIESIRSPLWIYVDPPETGS